MSARLADDPPSPWVSPKPVMPSRVAFRIFPFFFPQFSRTSDSAARSTQTNNVVGIDLMGNPLSERFECSTSQTT